MLRLLLRYPFHRPITNNSSCPTHLRLLHDTVPKTLTPSVSDVTVSYLVGSCGLSLAAALSIAKKFTLKSTGNADSFLSLLRAHGFNQGQIAYIVSSQPALISYNQEKKIKPKLEFFLNVGYSKADLVKLISSDPSILKASLENKIRPNFDMLKSILGTDKEVATAIGNSSRLLRERLDNCVLPNMKTLMELGVPGHRIIKLATFYPRAMMKGPAHFNQAIDLLKKMGFDASKLVFALGVNVLSGLSSSTWNKKLELFRSLGWSNEDTFTAFKCHPYCMLISEEKIKRNYGFFIEKLKWEPSYVAARSIILSYSFDKTISPRYKIFKFLTSNGLKKRTGDFASFLRMPRKKFFNDYVIKYADQVPELLEIYKNELESSRCMVEH
ncbi:hypothetical protein KFK09_000959 [Dendrobium nobile]|uniref:Uncharacterized protein n=1 Tax=Dendrobium nobile TaxID=94219 RepID=A0A8T3CD15_DENNO|nr:hypothetical protein KFK09_000959 [Dendrobium nobile]